jgi:hypothetical protein
MSRSRSLPQLARRAAPARSLTGGACAPLDAQPIPQARCKVPVVTGGEKPKAILCASSEEACGHVNQTKKTVPSRIGRVSWFIGLLQFIGLTGNSRLPGACSHRYRKNRWVGTSRPLILDCDACSDLRRTANPNNSYVVQIMVLALE